MRAAVHLQETLLRDEVDLQEEHALIPGEQRQIFVGHRLQFHGQDQHRLRRRVLAELQLGIEILDDPKRLHPGVRIFHRPKPP